MDEKKLIEHTIRIDAYMEVVMKIPEVLDAVELESLMLKSRKLFALSNIPLRKRGYNKPSLEPSPGPDNSESVPNGKFTAEMDAQLFRSKKNNMTWEKISHKLGKDKKKCMARMSYLKMSGRWNPSIMEGDKQ